MTRAETRAARFFKALVNLNVVARTIEQRRAELQVLLAERERRLEGTNQAPTPGFTRAQQMGLTVTKGR